MKDFSKWTCGLLLVAGLVLPVIGGCEGRVRVYDEYHHDYHHWDHREDRAYRFYYSDRHAEYRDYNSLSKNEQAAYWNWRHAHPDAGHS